MGGIAVTVTIAKLNELLEEHGSDVIYHHETGGAPCPCRTREGNRDPEYHVNFPEDPVCNELGMLAPVIDQFTVKATMQPVSAGGVRRSRSSERAAGLFPGEVMHDDHIGIFPVVWNGHVLDFHSFGDTGEDYVIYDTKRFIVIAADKLPDLDGDPNHHWELGLRLVRDVRVNA